MLCHGLPKLWFLFYFILLYMFLTIFNVWTLKIEVSPPKHYWANSITLPKKEKEKEETAESVALGWKKTKILA